MLLLKKGLLKKNVLFLVFYKMEFNPFVRGSVIKTSVVTPRKPNSARRPIAKILLINKNSVLSHIPGIGHNLRKHSLVLIRGGGARDLPMVSHSCVRGCYDLIGVLNRVTRRSIYGIKKNKNLLFCKKFVRL
jgi:small subunit ribosomal protein S12